MWLIFLELQAWARREMTAVKIGLIADTHGNLDGWEKAKEAVLHDADFIIHCGDVLYHGPKFTPAAGYDPAGLAAAINQMPVPVLIARGNADSEVDQLVLDVPLHQPYLFAQIEGVRLLATHGHVLGLDQLVLLAQKWRVDYLLTGHTHVPAVERYDELIHINPGTTTYPLASDQAERRCTCGAIEHGQVSIFDLATGDPYLTYEI